VWKVTNRDASFELGQQKPAILLKYWGVGKVAKTEHDRTNIPWKNINSRAMLIYEELNGKEEQCTYSGVEGTYWDLRLSFANTPAPRKFGRRRDCTAFPKQ
jgi:hypothetical protein